MKKILLFCLAIIIAVIGVYFLFNAISEQNKIEKINSKCLEDFATNYCNSINYSIAENWHNGFQPNLYFKCKNGREYSASNPTEYSYTKEERDYCRELSSKNTGVKQK